ncbi:MAG TPA: hypothetical protein VLW54_08320 [Candidatus Acidoferrales bacterium]|nr:hypothetical protein [Candidatus Acidoferrales bacterium]
MPRILIAAVLLASLALPGQDSKDYIVAARRSGVIEFIDPATLSTVGRIHLTLPQDSVGLNGVYLSADGSLLYIEGPLSDSPKMCCQLDSVDLRTLKTNRAAGIPGSPSREAFLISDGLVYPTPALMARGIMRDLNGDQFYFSPDSQWLFGVRTFPGPEVDIVDVARAQIVRRLTSGNLKGEGWFPSGTWSAGRFYFYAEKTEGFAARLWPVQPDTTQLGDGISVEPHGQVQGCSSPRLEKITASGGNLFLFELFGTKVDRRSQCHNRVPGGAWLLDPETGQLLRHVAPDLYLSTLIPDRTHTELYGLSIEDLIGICPVKLSRIDPRDGHVLQSRILDTDYWFMATAQLENAPTRDVLAVP